MAIYRVNKKYFIIIKSLYTLFCITNRGIPGIIFFSQMDSVTMYITHKIFNIFTCTTLYVKPKPAFSQTKYGSIINWNQLHVTIWEKSNWMAQKAF